jgi:hypothetical protein
MGAKRELEVGLNEHVNVVLRAALAAGEEGSGLEPDKRKAALLVAGLLSAAKAAVVQAGAIVVEMGLDGICDPPAADARMTPQIRMEPHRGGDKVFRIVSDGPHDSALYCEVQYDDKDFDAALAWAALIVRAVNTHADLEAGVDSAGEGKKE